MNRRGRRPARETSPVLAINQPQQLYRDVKLNKGAYIRDLKDEATSWLASVMFLSPRHLLTLDLNTART